MNLNIITSLNEQQSEFLADASTESNTLNSLLFETNHSFNHIWGDRNSVCFTDNNQ